MKIVQVKLLIKVILPFGRKVQGQTRQFHKFQRPLERRVVQAM